MTDTLTSARTGHALDMERSNGAAWLPVTTASWSPGLARIVCELPSKRREPLETATACTIVFAPLRIAVPTPCRRA